MFERLRSVTLSNAQRRLHTVYSSSPFEANKRTNISPTKKKKKMMKQRKKKKNKLEEFSFSHKTHFQNIFI